MLWIQDLQIPWNQWLLVSITVHTSLTIFLTQRPFERDTSLGRIKQQVRCNLLIFVVVVHLSRESSCNPNSVEILVHLCSGVEILVHLSTGVEILVHLSTGVEILTSCISLLVLKSSCISKLVLKFSCISLVVLEFSCIRCDEGGSQRWMPPAINRGPSLACATYLQILHCVGGFRQHRVAFTIHLRHIFEMRTRHWPRNTAIFMI